MGWLSRKRPDERGGAQAHTDGRAAWEHALWAVLATGPTAGPALATTLFAYVADGQGDPSPASANSGEAVRSALALSFGPDYQAVMQRNQALCRELAAMPPDAAYRWSRVVEAALVSGGSLLSLAPGPTGRWVESLVTYVVTSYDGNSYGHRTPIPVDHATLERILLAGGAPASAALRTCFDVTGATRSWSSGRLRLGLQRMPGYREAVVRNAESLRPVLLVPGADARLIALELLAPVAPGSLPAYAPELAQLAVSSSSKVRAVAAPLLVGTGPSALPPLRQLAIEGAPDERGHALTLLHRMDDPTVVAWAAQTAAADRAASVQSLATRWGAAEASTPSAGMPVAAPPLPLPVIDWQVPDTPELRELVGELCRSIDAELDRRDRDLAARARQHAATSSKPLPGYLARAGEVREPLDPRPLLEALRHPGPPATATSPPSVRPAVAGALFEKFARQPGMTPVVLVSTLHYFGQLISTQRRLTHPAAMAIDALGRSTGTPTLDELATMVDQLLPGIHLSIASDSSGADIVMQAVGGSGYVRFGRGWPPEALRDFAARHADAIIELLVAGNHPYDVDLRAYYELLGSVPELPRSTVDALVDLALGPRKGDRLPARAALAHTPGIDQKIAAALTDGRGEVRAQAALWLSAQGDAAAVPNLEKALAKERLDSPKGAMLDALQALGQPVERYLDRDDLTAEATKSVTKGLPKDLAWFRGRGCPLCTGATRVTRCPSSCCSTSSPRRSRRSRRHRAPSCAASPLCSTPRSVSGSGPSRCWPGSPRT